MGMGNGHASEYYTPTCQFLYGTLREGRGYSLPMVSICSSLSTLRYILLAGLKLYLGISESKPFPLRLGKITSLLSLAIV
jgi:hypothetical protein